jgi:hypothetical protein
MAAVVAILDRHLGFGSMPYPLLRVTSSSLRFKFDENRFSGSKVIAKY